MRGAGASTGRVQMADDPIGTELGAELIEVLDDLAALSIYGDTTAEVAAFLIRESLLRLHCQEGVGVYLEERRIARAAAEAPAKEE